MASSQIQAGLTKGNTVVIAMDDSEFSDLAFKCKFQLFTTRIKGSQDLR